MVEKGEKGDRIELRHKRPPLDREQ
jgi:hypothetical protein